jgi:hypothetical protein
VGPNLLLELRADGAQILQVTPLAPGRCRIRRFDFGARGPRAARGRRAAVGSGSQRQRRASAWLKGQIELAESTQAGLEAGADEAVGSGPVTPALAQFRAAIAALID